MSQQRKVWPVRVCQSTFSEVSSDTNSLLCLNFSPLITCCETLSTISAMRLVGARPQTFSCVGARHDFICLCDQCSFQPLHNEMDALSYCLMMQGLHISVEKSGSDVVLTINTKVLANYFHFYKNIEFSPQKMQLVTKYSPFVLFLHSAKIHPKKITAPGSLFGQEI